VETEADWSPPRTDKIKVNVPVALYVWLTEGVSVVVLVSSPKSQLKIKVLVVNPVVVAKKVRGCEVVPK
jgi:hypothetical protein